MKRYGQVFLLAIGFDLYWTLVVLFREQGLVIWIALAVLAGCYYRHHTGYTPLCWRRRVRCWTPSGR